MICCFLRCKLLLSLLPSAAVFFDSLILANIFRIHNILLVLRSICFVVLCENMLMDSRSICDVEIQCNIAGNGFDCKDVTQSWYVIFHWRLLFAVAGNTKPSDSSGGQKD